MHNETISFLYRIHADEAEGFEYLVRLDAQTLAQVREANEAPPAWTGIDMHRCAHCTLSREQHAHCPMAVALAPVVDAVSPLVSFATVDAEVETPQRTCRVTTSVQQVLSSLFGLIMATSDCPLMLVLRPMARFHLPFATREETIYRATASYMLSQYFLHQDGLPADLDLEGLREAYQRIQEVNMGIAERLRFYASGDATVNALVILDLFAQTLPLAIAEHLSDLAHLFAPYVTAMAHPQDRYGAAP